MDKGGLRVICEVLVEVGAVAGRLRLAGGVAAEEGHTLIGRALISVVALSPLASVDGLVSGDGIRAGFIIESLINASLVACHVLADTGAIEALIVEGTLRS